MRPNKPEDPVQTPELNPFKEEELIEFIRGDGKQFFLMFSSLRAMGVSKEQAARTAHLWTMKEQPRDGLAPVGES